MQFQTEKCFSSKDWRVAYITHILEQKPEESFIVKGKFLLKKKKIKNKCSEGSQLEQTVLQSPTLPVSARGAGHGGKYFQRNVVTRLASVFLTVHSVTSPRWKSGDRALTIGGVNHFHHRCAWNAI